MALSKSDIDNGKAAHREKERFTAKQGYDASSVSRFFFSFAGLKIKFIPFDRQDDNYP